jgi:CRISPR/Cas system CSM-associated protein Csm4 (group 5 of RAMP superfamily)
MSTAQSKKTKISSAQAQMQKNSNGKKLKCQQLKCKKNSDHNSANGKKRKCQQRKRNKAQMSNVDYNYFKTQQKKYTIAPLRPVCEAIPGIRW